MRRLRTIRFVRALLAAVVLATAAPEALLAQEPPAPATAEPPPLELTRELIKSGDYDRAIEDLKGVIARERTRIPTLREAYLLLIKTYVFLGNDYKLKPQGREASNLNYRAARELIAECLRVRELRHTQPEPASEYPPEMVGFFGEVRAQLFGAFSVVSLMPSDALVLLDSDTLRALPGKDAVGDVDLAVGRHLVVIRAPRYDSVSEEITISPNSTLERSYQLKRRRGRLWYATRAGAALGVAGLGLVLSRHGSGTTEEPLPAAPPPPAQ